MSLFFCRNIHLFIPHLKLIHFTHLDGMYMRVIRKPNALIEKRVQAIFHNFFPFRLIYTENNGKTENFRKPNRQVHNGM